MGVIDWFKDTFGFNKEDDTIDYEEIDRKATFSEDLVRIIHINPNVYLAHKAARICIGKDVDEDFDKRMKHLEGVIGINKHESVAEHTNVIAIFIIRKVHVEIVPGDFAELMSVLKYCNVVRGIGNKEEENIYLLVGGSIRAFMHAIREMTNYNYFKQYIETLIYNSFEKCFVKSLIDAELIDGDKCTYLPNGEVSLVPSSITQIKNKFESREEENYDAECNSIEDPMELLGPHVDVVYMSSIDEIHDKVKRYGFNLNDVYQVATISFVFHNISKSCSHQLVRHRNAISQESQRYVLHDYTYNDFVNPIDLNREDKYSDKRYKEVMEKTISIANRGFSDYKWLIEHKVTKEDARAFLPINVTTKLMMTMTYKNYAYFLQLRLDKAAQKEIRNLAEESAAFVIDDSKVKDFIEYLTTPRALKKTPITEIYVDEVIEEKYIEPTPMEIKTEESAQVLLDKQEQYKKMEV